MKATGRVCQITTCAKYQQSTLLPLTSCRPQIWNDLYDSCRDVSSKSQLYDAASEIKIGLLELEL